VRESFFRPSVVRRNVLGIEGQDVRYRDFSRITRPSAGAGLMLAVEVELKRAFSSCKVVLRALRALAMSTVLDVPDCGMGDAAGGITAFWM
jgi:hypothetical protein